MTNREYIEQNLTNEELAYFIYNGILNVGRRYTHSELGVASWLSEERYPEDSVWLELEQVKKWL